MEEFYKFALRLGAQKYGFDLHRKKFLLHTDRKVAPENVLRGANISYRMRRAIPVKHDDKTKFEEEKIDVVSIETDRRIDRNTVVVSVDFVWSITTSRRFTFVLEKKKGRIILIRELRNPVV